MKSMTTKPLSREDAEILGYKLMPKRWNNAGKWEIRDTILAMSDEDQHTLLLGFPALAEFALPTTHWNKRSAKDTTEEYVADIEGSNLEEHGIIESEQPAVKEDKSIDDILDGLI